VTITIREANIANLEAVSVLFDAYRQFYQQAPDLKLSKQFIEQRMRRSESVILLAFDTTQRAIGFCQLYPTFCSVEATDIYVLYDLFVIPNGRRSGAGKQLLLAAEQVALENGKSRMDLSTAKTNLPAQAAYEALGWVRDEVFYTYSKHVRQGDFF
jgi:ribosomal protein S18 acetylase RimI-like enzyme